MTHISTSYLVVGILTVIFILYLIQGKTQECFVNGENTRMEPQYNYYFNKCLQSYPIAFRGPINSGYYTCLRKTDDLLRNLG